MTDEENNEVLAKFAGIVHVSRPGEAPRWRCPDSTILWDEPDFLHSLDAQAKWLIPKTQDMGYEMRVMGGKSGSDFHVMFVHPPEGIIHGIKQAATEAEARAEAILSLIGEQVKP